MRRVQINLQTMSRVAASLAIVGALALEAYPQALHTVSESAAKHAAIDKPAPGISQLARQMKVSGKVEVTVVINEQGSVKAVKIVSGNALLAEGVVIAVRQWKFHPFVEDGTATAVATI